MERITTLSRIPKSKQPSHKRKNIPYSMAEGYICSLNLLVQNSGLTIIDPLLKDEY